MSDLRLTSVGPAQTVWIFNPSSGEEEEGNETPGPELTAFVTGVPLLFSTSSNFSRVCVCAYLVALLRLYFSVSAGVLEKSCASASLTATLIECKVQMY